MSSCYWVSWATTEDSRLFTGRRRNPNEFGDSSINVLPITPSYKGKSDFVRYSSSMAMLQAPAPLERSIFQTPSGYTACDSWATPINRDSPWCSIAGSYRRGTYHYRTTVQFSCTSVSVTPAYATIQRDLSKIRKTGFSDQHIYLKWNSPIRTGFNPPAIVI